MEVKWDENVCSHAGVCVTSLPNVFKVEDGKSVINKSVINTEADSEAKIRDIVSKNPSGALSIQG